MDYQPFYVTFKLAGLTTLILLVLCIPLAFYLAHSKRKLNILVESLLMLPIVMPPTVLGYYFIVFLGPKTALGGFFENTLGIPLIFSFEGILLGSMIYCLPFMLNPLVSGFRNLPRNLYESAQVFGKSKFATLWYVLLPNIKPALITAVLLTFAHTIGEFGVVLMIGGSLPETEVASVAIYNALNGLAFEEAHTYAIYLLAISFILIIGINLVGRRNLIDHA